MKSIFYSFLLILWVSSAFAQTKNDLQTWLKKNHVELSFRLNKYDYAHYNRLVSSWYGDDSQRINSPTANFEVSYEITDYQENDFFEIAATFDCVKGEINDASISVEFKFEQWSEENYVLMPGVVYDGNKPFKVYKSPEWYPFITDNRYLGPDKPPYVADIPRLSNDGGVSKIQLQSGHMATPSIGFQNDTDGRGFLLLTHQQTQFGDNGISIEENRDRTGAAMTLTAPVVRELYRYRFMRNDYPSDDVPATFKKGDKITLKFRLYFFDAPEIQSLYDKFAQERKAMSVDDVELETSYPFSNAFGILEEKFNKYQWKKKQGFYKYRYKKDTLQKVRMNSIYTYALLVDGDEVSKKRVLSSLDWFFANGISPSGHVWATETNGVEFGGKHPGQIIADSVTLVRRSADALFYFIRHFDVIKANNMAVKPEWEVATKKVAAVLIQTWEKYGQLGQWVSLNTGDIIVGNSTSGGITPAGLILAARYFEDEKMKKVALEMGEHFYQNYTKRGLTYGGPGDVLNSPDCEASYGLVESFTLLYEATGDKKWLTYAEEAAKQFATWVMSYNFKFPSTSHFGKLGIKPMGSVFASPQNGTGTPGICTYSGISLLNLTRYTNDEFYANLLLDIARHLPQYLSHPDKMLNPEHVGWMSERVVTADWLQEIGEISYHTTWPEASLALTYSEIPGVYISKANKSLIAFDNIHAELLKVDKKKVKVKLVNPTRYEADVKVFVDNGLGREEVVGGHTDYQIIKLLPNEEKVVSLD